MKWAQEDVETLYSLLNNNNKVVLIIKPTTIVVCTVKKKTPDDGQRNCPKHVEFYSKNKNKFEKVVHLVGFIVRISHFARSPERQIHNVLFPFIICI